VYKLASNSTDDHQTGLNICCTTKMLCRKSALKIDHEIVTNCTHSSYCSLTTSLKFQFIWANSFIVKK